MRRTTRWVVAIMGLATLATCRPAEPEAGATGMPEPGAVTPAPATYPPTVAAQLDSGNTAYSTGNFEEALRHYRLAAEAGPGISATWFGVYMANHALGNLQAADSALARARDQVPGATLVRPGAADTAVRQ